jgi:catechol 2,3-dioxygenase-like lactoylglutathione lyase family enzyme
MNDMREGTVSITGSHPDIWRGALFMTPSVPRETFVQATRDLPEVRITEVVLQTARWQEMKDWYSAFLGVELFFETETLCFRRVSSAHNQLFVLIHFPKLQDRPESVTALNHAQFKCNTLRDTPDRYDQLKVVGIVPVRSFNHGPGTSFYYRDADGNTMEISGPNFATEAEGRAYMQSDTFQRNPRGVAIDPDDFVAKFRNGMPQAELVRIP